MDKTKKIFLMLIITFLLTNIFNQVYARSVLPDGITAGQPDSSQTQQGSSGTTINPNDYKPGELNADDSTINMANKIIGAFQAIGSIISVLALVIIGIKYMMGSVEEKAEYKKTLMYYIIGAILVFAISNISALLYDFATTLNT